LRVRRDGAKPGDQQKIQEPLHHGAKISACFPKINNFLWR
jgi:hypothetical protein